MLESPFGLCLPAQPRYCRTDDRRIGRPPSNAVQQQEPKFRQLLTPPQQELLRCTFTVFRSAPAFTASKLLEGSHGGTGRFARQGIFSGDDTWQGGDGPSSQQGPSNHLCSLERQKPCCQKYRDLSLAAALHQSRCPPVGSIEPVRASRPTKTSFTRVGSLIANSGRTSSSTARAGIEVVCRERRLLIGSGPVISALRDVKLARPGRSRKPEFG